MSLLDQENLESRVYNPTNLLVTSEYLYLLSLACAATSTITMVSDLIEAEAKAWYASPSSCKQPIDPMRTKVKRDSAPVIYSKIEDGKLRYRTCFTYFEKGRSRRNKKTGIYEIDHGKAKKTRHCREHLSSADASAWMFRDIYLYLHGNLKPWKPPASRNKRAREARCDKRSLQSDPGLQLEQNRKLIAQELELMEGRKFVRKALRPRQPKPARKTASAPVEAAVARVRKRPRTQETIGADARLVHASAKIYQLEQMVPGLEKAFTHLKRLALPKMDDGSTPVRREELARNKDEVTSWARMSDAAFYNIYNQVAAVLSLCKTSLVLWKKYFGQREAALKVAGGKKILKGTYPKFAAIYHTTRQGWDQFATTFFHKSKENWAPSLRTAQGYFENWMEKRTFSVPEWSTKSSSWSAALSLPVS